MPGYDSTGPLGTGPRTGRGLGRCGPTDRAAPVGARYQGYGLGRGGPPWGGGRGRGFGGGGRGRRRGSGITWNSIEGPASPDVIAPQQENTLMRKIEELTAAVDRLKELLWRSLPAEGQDHD